MTWLVAVGLLALDAGLWWALSSLLPGLSLVVLVWLVAMNVGAVAVYGYDKAIAGKGVRRIPENTLHLFTLLGGDVGAYLAMEVFRHKTVKSSFRSVFWLIVALHVIVIVLLQPWGR